MAESLKKVVDGSLTNSKAYSLTASLRLSLAGAKCGAPQHRLQHILFWFLFAVFVNVRVVFMCLVKACC
jgi:hypothetical protein